MKIKTILQSEAGTLVVLKMIIALLLFSSCTEDASLQDKDMDYKSGGLIIRVPNGYSSNFDTKAGEEENEENSSAEGGIKNLWMFAFPVDNNGEIFIKQLIGYNELNVTDSEEDEVYKKYEITDIKDGTYHFYFLANLDDYLDTNSKDYLSVNSDASEEDIKGLILNYTESSDKAKKIVAGNLPMACIYNEVKVREGGSKILKSEIPISKASMTEIFADLTFLCTKVRYTILFDKTDRGFSNSFSDSNIDFETPYATSIKSKTDVTPETLKDEVEYLSQTNLELEHVNIPNNYEKGSSIENLIFEAGTWEEQDVKKAWQGIVYLPENIQSSDNNEKKTKIIFPAKGTNVNDEYELTLLSSTYKDLNNDSDPDWSGIKRGHFYDIVITMEKPYQRELPMEVEVKDWDLESLSYEIKGPIDLTVDQTTVSVTAGETTILHYETSSGSEVWGESPKYTLSNGEEIDFYNFKYNDNGNIEITVNDNIPIGIGSSKSDYEYFYICIGNLKKRIDVDLLIQPYLHVSPETINISVQQYISSGVYSNSQSPLHITFDTNYDKLEITVADKTITNDGKSVLGNQDATEVLMLSNILQGSKNGELDLVFHGLNMGYAFWKSNHTYQVAFKATYTDSEGNEIEKTETVTITVLPYTTDYIIHFKSIDNSWTNPHIYVYQPLELPADLKGTNSEHAGWTVGYKDESGNFHDAVEYDFTFGIAFKGWKGYGDNHEQNENDPNATGYDNGTYYIFHDGNDGRTFWADNAHKDLSDKRYYREVHSNFNHQEKIRLYGTKVCNSCYALDQKTGICMQKEEIGGVIWWTYTLTGVATPGKALIRFNNGHSYNQDQAYPKMEDKGIALFDFPDNEGWFLYDESKKDDLQFVNERPYINPVDDPEEPEIVYTHRLYWSKNMGEYIHFWLSNQNVTGYGPDGSVTDYNNGGEEGNYYYWDFDLITTGELWYNTWYETSSNSGGRDTTFTDVTFEDGKTRKTATLYSAGNMQSGRPR